MFESATIDWGDLVTMPEIIFVIGGIIAVAAIVAPQVRRMRRASEEARLKEQMIQQGFSASEIERVIRAQGDEEDSEESE